MNLQEIAASIPSDTFHNATLSLDGLAGCCEFLGKEVALRELPAAFAQSGRPMAYTLLGIMERVYCMSNGNLAFNKTVGGCSLYDTETGAWVPLESDERSRRVDDVLRYLAEEESPLLSGNKAAQEAIDKLLEGPQCFHNVPQKYINTFTYLSNIRDAKVVAEADYDAHDDLLLVKNGVVNLRTGVLMPMSPDYLFRVASKTTYTPGYTCDMFKNFISGIMAGGSDPLGKTEYLQRVAGASITGYAKDKLLVRLYDANGDTGKTTFIEALMCCLGDYAQTVEPQTIFSNENGNNRAFALARMIGARLVVMSETDSENTGFRLNATAIKRFVGTDTQVARRPCEIPVKFIPKYTAWMLTNGETKLTGGGDKAFWSRIKTIEFCNSIAKKDPIYVENAKDPKSEFVQAMLAWAVEGSVKYLKHGLSEESIEIKKATESYRDSVCPFTEFMDDLEFAPNYWVSVAALRVLYKNHDSVADMKVAPSVEAMSAELTKRLGGRKSEVRRVLMHNGKKSTKAIRIWVGVRPKHSLAEVELGDIEAVPTHGEFPEGGVE